MRTAPATTSWSRSSLNPDQVTLNIPDRRRATVRKEVRPTWPTARNRESARRRSEPSPPRRTSTDETANLTARARVGSHPLCAICRCEGHVPQEPCSSSLAGVRSAAAKTTASSEAGHQLLLVAVTIERNKDLNQLLDALGADERFLQRGPKRPERRGQEDLRLGGHPVRPHPRRNDLRHELRATCPSCTATSAIPWRSP
jgi:hypothetical protein